MTRLFNLQDEYKVNKTWDGNNIWALKISKNVSSDGLNPNILLVANHHAREIINPELLYDTSYKLLEGYQYDPLIKNIINENNIYVIWTMNPDGLNYVWKKDRFWRKNRRNNKDGTYGVDLNRNYPAGWDLPCGNNRSTIDDYYGGPFQASEPEIQAMIAFQKSKNFVKVLDYHSAGREVRYNYGCGKLPEPIQNMAVNYANLMSSKINYKAARSCCMGGNIAYAYMKHGSLSNLIETFAGVGRERHQPNYTIALEEIARVWPGTIEALQWKAPVRIFVLDSDNQYLNVQITVKNLDFQFGETWKSIRGISDLWLPLGNWTIEFRQKGFYTQTQTFESLGIGFQKTYSVQMSQVSFLYSLIGVISISLALFLIFSVVFIVLLVWIVKKNNEKEYYETLNE